MTSEQLPQGLPEPSAEFAYWGEKPLAAPSKDWTTDIIAFREGVDNNWNDGDDGQGWCGNSHYHYALRIGSEIHKLNFPKAVRDSAPPSVAPDAGTPRTDDCLTPTTAGGTVPAHFARTLERQLTESERLRKDGRDELNNLAHLLRTYGWQNGESVQMFLHRGNEQKRELTAIKQKVEESERQAGAIRQALAELMYELEDDEAWTARGGPLVYRNAQKILSETKALAARKERPTYPCRECGKDGVDVPNTICPICGGE